MPTYIYTYIHVYIEEEMKEFTEVKYSYLGNLGERSMGILCIILADFR